MLTGDHRADLLFYALLIVLPVSALIARRVPMLRVVWTLASWAAVLGIATVFFSQRERFDPYLTKIARVLNLDDQRVVGSEVHIRMSADGHFWARATLDGVPRRMLIDSGATVTAVSPQTAGAAGLEAHAGPFPMLLQTANGTVAAKRATIGSLRLGDVVARDLAVVVAPGMGDTDVLGMNFLSRLKSWRVEGSTLILVPHHPNTRFT